MHEVTLERVGGSAKSSRLNIVFVHGLGGDARGTWLFIQKPRATNLIARFSGVSKQRTKPKKHFWPGWLAKDSLGSAVYCVGYPADKMGWNAGWPIEDASVAILDRLMKYPELRKSDAPIVFICHSLGGIVVKQLVLKANSGRDGIGQSNEKGAFLDRVVGVVFLSTPHDGSVLATLASQFGWLVTDTMRDLIANSSKLGNLSDQYRDYVAKHGRIRHLVYHEKEGIGGVKVVSSGSANPGLVAVDRVPIGRNHIDICKIARRNDQVYHGVLAFLEDALKPKALTTDQILGAILSRVDQLTAEVSREEEIRPAVTRVNQEHINEAAVARKQRHILDQRKLFDDHIQPIYEMLEKIHQDYIETIFNVERKLKGSERTLGDAIDVMRARQAQMKTIKDKFVGLVGAYKCVQSGIFPEQATSFFEECVAYFQATNEFKVETREDRPRARYDSWYAYLLGDETAKQLEELQDENEEAEYQKRVVSYIESVAALKAMLSDRWMKITSIYGNARIYFLTS